MDDQNPADLPEGLYDRLISTKLARFLADSPALVAKQEPLSPTTAPDMLSKHIAHLVRAKLAAFPGTPAERLEQQLALTNQLIHMLSPEQTAAADHQLQDERLLQVRRRDTIRLGDDEMVRPTIPLRHSALLVNGPNDLRVGLELRKELASADRVDILVSFVKWSGFVEIRDALRAFSDRHGDKCVLRVLTTTYMGATELRALEALQELGAEIRVSYDERRTRLHAKAWLFHRNSGYSTAFVGSSNLSYAALRDGCEWNVRLSKTDNEPILRKFEATFQQYWDDSTFEPFDSERFITVTNARRSSTSSDHLRAVQLHPYPHQRAVLDALAAEREAGHVHNLVVAATGTGKTVMAALDYRRIAKEWGYRPSLLFVAHRREILTKSQATYAVALQEPFGELLTGKDKPLVGRHVFASVQSLRAARLEALAPDAYDIVVVDEFHHAEADTYAALLRHLKPKILLGLTATPERTDGRSVLHWFDDRVAAESRLWDALDQGLLVPFQYFGLHDGTDLSMVDFRSGRYAISELENLYTADDHRARLVLRAVADRVRDPEEMRALGFCVSVKHAEFMAAFFNRHGLPAMAVTGTTSTPERTRAVTELAAGRLCALFTVDVFNEGVDIPEVDTVLFLRPTESATVFLQQLGRGLRLHDGKTCLTVLDFVGTAHREFRFDLRYRALLGGGTRREIESAVTAEFPRLPSGCSIQLDRETQRAVLDNLKRTLRRWAALADDLVEDWPLQTFLERTELDLSELYLERRSFSELRFRRGYIDSFSEDSFSRALPRMLYIDDPVRLGTWLGWLRQERPIEADPADALQRMLMTALGQGRRPLSELQDIWNDVWARPVFRDELVQLLEVLDGRRRRSTQPLDGLPFRVHATYSRDEISAGLNEIRNGKILRTQGGVLKSTLNQCDVFYVTLDKDEAEFTPTTLYNDYPISPWRFHWESQSTTRFESATGRRYRNPPPGWRIILFVRSSKTDSRGIANPYLCLGPVQCDSASGERPIQVIWNLEHPMPAEWFGRVKVAAG